MSFLGENIFINWSFAYPSTYILLPILCPLISSYSSIPSDTTSFHHSSHFSVFSLFHIPLVLLINCKPTCPYYFLLISQLLDFFADLQHLIFTFCPWIYSIMQSLVYVYFCLLKLSILLQKINLEWIRENVVL